MTLTSKSEPLSPEDEAELRKYLGWVERKAVAEDGLEVGAGFSMADGFVGTVKECFHHLETQLATLTADRDRLQGEVERLSGERAEAVDLITEYRKAVAFAGAEAWDGALDMRERFDVCEQTADGLGITRPATTLPRAAASARTMENLNGE